MDGIHTIVKWSWDSQFVIRVSVHRRSATLHDFGSWIESQFDPTSEANMMQVAGLDRRHIVQLIHAVRACTTPRICVHAFYSCMQRAYTNNLPRSWFYCSYLQRRLLAAIDRCFAAGKQPVPAPRRLVRTVPSFVQSATGSLSSLLASLIVCSSFKYHRCQKRYICYWPAVSYNALTQL